MELNQHHAGGWEAAPVCLLPSPAGTLLSQGKLSVLLGSSFALPPFC